MLTFQVGERCFYVYLHKLLLLSKSLWFLNSDTEGSDSRGCHIIGIFDSCISFQIANSKSLTANSLSERLSESIWFLSWNSVWITRVNTIDICIGITLMSTYVWTPPGKIHRKWISGCY